MPMAAANAKRPPKASEKGVLFIARAALCALAWIDANAGRSYLTRFMSQIDRSLAEAARAWPLDEARKLVARTAGKVRAKGYVLFETGYGPSGLPNIGPF